jgi:hypothetical protein
MAEAKSSVNLSDTMISQLRIEKARLCAQTGEFWSYENLLEALLVHWQLNPPATLPQRREVVHNYEAVAG